MRGSSGSFAMALAMRVIPPAASSAPNAVSRCAPPRARLAEADRASAAWHGSFTPQIRHSSSSAGKVALQISGGS
jgi:hypothetical protein